MLMATTTRWQRAEALVAEVSSEKRKPLSQASGRQAFRSDESSSRVMSSGPVPPRRMRPSRARPCKVFLQLSGMSTGMGRRSNRR